jgi:hypothetical protein
MAELRLADWPDDRAQPRVGRWRRGPDEAQAQQRGDLTHNILLPLVD